MTAAIRAAAEQLLDALEAGPVARVRTPGGWGFALDQHGGVLCTIRVAAPPGAVSASVTAESREQAIERLRALVRAVWPATATTNDNIVEILPCLIPG